MYMSGLPTLGNTLRRSIWRRLGTIQNRRRVRAKVYYSFDGTSWTDLTTFNSTANFCIKALTAATIPTPTITSLSGTPDPVTAGNNLTLTAVGVTDPVGTVQSVSFYRESNGTSGLQTGTGGDALVGTAGNILGGWYVTIPTAGLAPGTYTYYAQATDNFDATSNVVSTTNTVQAASLPDLTPYQPSGWSNKIVVSTETGTDTDAAQITTSDTLYIDWAVINQGQAATSAPFTTELLLNNVPEHSWTTSAPLNPDWYTYVQDYAISPLAAGTYR